MDELKLIFASNLIRLRTAAGMTQARSITCSTSTTRGSPDPSPPRATAAIMPSSLSPSWAS